MSRRDTLLRRKHDAAEWLYIFDGRADSPFAPIALLCRFERAMLAAVRQALGARSGGKRELPY